MIRYAWCRARVVCGTRVQLPVDRLLMRCAGVLVLLRESPFHALYVR